MFLEQKWVGILHFEDVGIACIRWNKTISLKICKVEKIIRTQKSAAVGGKQISTM